MGADFDTLVDRRGMASVKEFRTSDTAKERGLVSLWGAEFEFPTAPCITQAVAEWAKKGLAAYTVADDDYLTLVKNWMHFHRGWEIEKEWIVPTYGLTFSVGTIVRAFTEPGDGVIGLEPVYHVTWEPVLAHQRRKVSCPLLYDGVSYSIDWEMLAKLCADPRNKVLYWCNPHNPLGKVWGREDLVKVAAIAQQYGVILYSDEIFGDTVYEGEKMLTFSQVTDYDGWIVGTSLGKTFSITGVGQANFIIKSPGLRESFRAQRDKDHYGSFDPFMRAAYFGGYTREGSLWVREMMRYCYGNYEWVAAFCKEHLPWMHPQKPGGTYILWLDCRELDFADEEAYTQLFAQAGFGCDNGVMYGSAPGFIRITLSVPATYLHKAFYALEEEVRYREMGGAEADSGHRV